MSKLAEAIYDRLGQIVLGDHRPVSWLDFKDGWTADGKVWTLKHQTFRLHVANLIKSGRIEKAFKDIIVFYTLPDHKFGRIPSTQPSTQTPLLGSKTDLRWISQIAYEKRAIHNWHFTFSANGLWRMLSFDPRLLPKSNSKDIHFKCTIEGLNFVFVVHQTDAVTLSVSCTYNPIIDDLDNLILFQSRAIAARQKVVELVEEIAKTVGRTNDIEIPFMNTWMITMWHVGRDSIESYSGESFCVRFELANGELLTAYSKIMQDGERIVRLDDQQYPKKTYAELIRGKIHNGIG